MIRDLSNGYEMELNLLRGEVEYRDEDYGIEKVRHRGKIHLPSRGILTTNLKTKNGSLSSRIAFPKSFYDDRLFSPDEFIFFDEQKLATDFLSSIRGSSAIARGQNNFKAAEIECPFLNDLVSGEKKPDKLYLYVVFDKRYYDDVPGFDISGVVESVNGGLIWHIFVTGTVLSPEEILARRFIKTRDKVRAGKLKDEQVEQLKKAEEEYFETRSSFLRQVNFDPDSTWFVQNNTRYRTKLTFAAYDLWKERLEEHPHWIFREA